MANFNSVKAKNTVYTHENGYAYSKSILDEWVNFLFSSFLEDGFYEIKDSQQRRFLELTQKIADKYGVPFVAKCAVFARNELGMRSISQLTAAWLNSQSFENKRLFYRNFMHRPDDVAEIFAAIDSLKEKRSHALVRGAADYLSVLTDYQIGKYKLRSRNYNMYDLINLTHAWSPSIQRYKTDMLQLPDTWEVKISKDQSQEERSREWIALVENHSLGYMSLIRNLNNILNCEDIDDQWIKDYLVPQITDAVAIKKSLIFPYRLFTAYRNLDVFNFNISQALADAFLIAINNMPNLKGVTGICLDVSGSMTQPISNHSDISIMEVGACYAVAIFLANPNCQIVKFGTTAKQISLNKLENPFSLISQLCANDKCGYGTYITPALNALKNIGIEYSQIFLISDMQVMDRTCSNIYTYLFGDTALYSFDLGNYKTQITPQHKNIHYITTLNDQVFKLIAIAESGINLVDYINQFNYC